MANKIVTHTIPKIPVVIYQTKSGALELRGDATHETVWATQAQIVALFSVDQSVVSRHIKNVFADGEVSEKSNMQKMHIANSDKPTILYSLDVILSVGYRTNSRIAIEFRQWATKTLRQHITSGYTINRGRIAKNYDEFIAAVDKVRTLLPAGNELDAKSTLDLVRLFADTWFSLDAYDKESLTPTKVTKKKVKLTASELQASIEILKTELMSKGEASENFAQERNREALEGIVGNIMQSFGGAEMYPSVQAKAAHLLYFVIKNHPFVDGNKRSGAYAFVWYLQKARVLNTNHLTPTALTALTILIAESNPVDKEKMVTLVTTLISQQ